MISQRKALRAAVKRAEKEEKGKIERPPEPAGGLGDVPGGVVIFGIAPLLNPRYMARLRGVNRALKRAMDEALQRRLKMLLDVTVASGVAAMRFMADLHEFRYFRRKNGRDMDFADGIIVIGPAESKRKYG